jgi:diguanylate cyclase (GGDEF)-like protein/PAS domain S-box-containing protein
MAADVLAGSPGVSETLERVVVAGRRALSADRATCYLLGPRGRVGMVHTTDTDPVRREIIEGAVARDMPIARIMRSRASPVLTVSDAGRSRVVPGGLAERLRVGALMAVRLSQAGVDAQTEVEVGWLFFSWRSPRPFLAADRRLARAFAVHATHALSNARAREKVRRASDVGARAQRIGRMGGWEWDVEGGCVETAERLARSEAHLSEAQRIASLGSWAWEIDGGHIEWSVEFSRVLGLPEDTVQGLDVFFAAVHPADGERVQLSVAACIEQSTPIDVVCRRRPDGTIRVIHSHAEPVTRDETGRATRYMGAVQDVTERVAREDRLRESEERNRRLAAEQAALRRVGTAVATGATPEAIFGQVAAEVGALLDVRAGVVWRFEGDRSVAVGSWGHRRSQVGVAFSLEGDGAVPLAWRTGRAATVDYPSLAESDPTAARVRPQGYRSGVAAPIAIDGKPWGAVLAATSDERVFSEEEKHGLERFADLVGLAIANADAWSQLVARAASDPLTGLANHRTVHETIRREVARANRHGRSLAVALFDLDHFKEVNDIHGHQVGDQVLEAIASTLQAIARPGDLVGRLGGEEFVWLMPETDALGAYDAAERLERTRILTGLRALARAVDAKDPSTQRHSERVATLAGDIAAAHGWTNKGIADLRDAALVHDSRGHDRRAGLPAHGVVEGRAGGMPERGGQAVRPPRSSRCSSRSRPRAPSAPSRSPADRGAHPARPHRVSLSVNRRVPPGPTKASL